MLIIEATQWQRTRGQQRPAVAGIHNEQQEIQNFFLLDKTGHTIPSKTNNIILGKAATLANKTVNSDIGEPKEDNEIRNSLFLESSSS